MNNGVSYLHKCYWPRSVCQHQTTEFLKANNQLANVVRNNSLNKVFTENYSLTQVICSILISKTIFYIPQLHEVTDNCSLY